MTANIVDDVMLVLLAIELALACAALRPSTSSQQSPQVCIASSSASFHQRQSSVSLSCQVPLLCCHFSTIVHPSGMLLLPVVFGNVLEQVNVPDAATPFTQFVVAFVGSHAVKLTSIDVSLLQPSNMP